MKLDFSISAERNIRYRFPKHLKIEAMIDTIAVPSRIGEITGTLPITFKSNGTSLLDWRIKGAAGGVGRVGTNKLNYKPIARGSGPGGTYTDSGTIAGVAMNAVSIPDGAPADADHQRWYMLRANINEGGNWVDDYRSPTYANCNWYAKLTAGTYKLIAECANPYGKTVRVPNLDSIYRNDSVLPGNHIPRYDLVDSSGNILIEVTWENFFGSGNQRRWTRKESLFTVTEDIDVGVFSKMFQYDSSYAVDNITPYLVFRYMIVPADTPTSQFSVTLPISGEPEITGESCWEPYKVTLPLTVSSGELSKTVIIDLGTEFLGENDFISFETTSELIPTFGSINTLNVDSSIPPSEVYIKYTKLRRVHQWIALRSNTWSEEKTKTWEEIKYGGIDT